MAYQLQEINRSIRADVAVDGVTKPIVTQNSTMYHLLADGVDKNLSSATWTRAPSCCCPAPPARARPPRP